MAGRQDYNQYGGSRVVVYAAGSQDVIADTQILEYNVNTHVITIAAVSIKGVVPDRVVMLIFFKDTLFEYHGTVRRAGIASGRVEIALYKGQSKEGRTTKRHTLNAPATISNSIVDGKLFPLRQPITVIVVNLSTSGCLLRGQADIFRVGAAFQLVLTHENTVMQIHTVVMRVLVVDEQACEYGCKFKLAK